MTRRLGSWQRCTRMARRRAAASASDWRVAPRPAEAAKPAGKPQDGQG